jgi:fructokinase
MRIGIDVGGTKIEAIALDQDGREIARQRTPTPRNDYRATLEAMKSLVDQLEVRLQQSGSIGVGMPGAIDARTGLIKNANSTWLNGKPMDKDLSALLGRKVPLENDANCFALSEAVDGAATGASIVFGVIIGTGCGGGLVIDGQPIGGANRIAGEWGHNPLPDPVGTEVSGPSCYCGKKGCIETYLSGPGMADRFKDATGRMLSPKDICALSDDGDHEANLALELYEDRMARALSTVVNLLDPDVIVLGGGMSNISRLYDNVPAKMVPYIMSDDPIIELRQNIHGDSSGVRGAAWLWPLETPSKH